MKWGCFLDSRPLQCQNFPIKFPANDTTCQAAHVRSPHCRDKPRNRAFTELSDAKNATAHHDTLAYRLTQILGKLNQGDKLDPQALADEFGVHLRTIQRDLNERFAFLPMEKTGDCYHLHPTCLGKLSLRDVERFAGLAGVRGLFPSLSDDFLRDIFDSRLQSALLVKGPNYEDLGGREGSFRQLEQAIPGAPNHRL